MPIYRTWRPGDDPKVGRKDFRYTDWGFRSEVSQREFEDLAGQVEDAVSFLTKFSNELSELVTKHKLDAITLDFPLSLPTDPSIIAMCRHLPAHLLKLAGNLGISIELSFYPVLEDDEGSPPSELRKFQ